MTTLSMIFAEVFLCAASSMAEVVSFSTEVIPDLVSHEEGTKHFFAARVVRVTRRATSQSSTEDYITFSHRDGVTTLPLIAFDDLNKDRLIPGYLARQQAATQKAAALEQRVKNEYSLVEEKLRQAVTNINVGRDSQSAKPIGVDPLLRCVLVSGYSSYALGEAPLLQVRILNMSHDEVSLFRPDSSFDFNSGPIGFIVESSEAKRQRVPTFLGSWCGIPLGTKPLNVITIPAGTSFDPFFEKNSPERGVRLRAGFAKPGRYRVRFHYSTASKDIRSYVGWPAEPAFLISRRGPSTEELQRFSEMAHVDVSSNEIELEFVSKLMP